MAIFNSYVTLPEGTCHKYPPCLVSQCPAASALAGCGIAVTTGTLGRANVGLTGKNTTAVIF